MTRDDFDKKFDYYSSKRESLGLTSVWSIYEVDSLRSEEHTSELQSH